MEKKKLKTKKNKKKPLRKRSIKFGLVIRLLLTANTDPLEVLARMQLSCAKFDFVLIGPRGHSHHPARKLQLRCFF